MSEFDCCDIMVDTHVFGILEQMAAQDLPPPSEQLKLFEKPR